MKEVGWSEVVVGVCVPGVCVLEEAIYWSVRVVRTRAASAIEKCSDKVGGRLGRKVCHKHTLVNWTYQEVRALRTYIFVRISSFIPIVPYVFRVTFQSESGVTQVVIQESQLSGDESCIARLASPAADVDDVEAVVDQRSD